MNTIIIAEAGINHDGELNKAIELVKSAATCGVDYIKFQTFVTADNICKDAPKAKYQYQTTGHDDNQFEMVSKLELCPDDFFRIKEECDKQSIGFLSTAFDKRSADLVASFDVDYIKIPSGDLTNLPLLRYLSTLADNFLVSTGMATMADIAAAISVLEKSGVSKANITVLHCTTEYPAPFNQINLNAMRTISDAFDVSIGYSDHTKGIEVPIAAVALGAKVIEKHFTLDSTSAGPDHFASLEPDELMSMVVAIRNIEMALGDTEKKPTESELENSLIARKSIVANKTIISGQLIQESDLATKRPGIGISPMLWDSVVGSISKRTFEPDEFIEL